MPYTGVLLLLFSFFSMLNFTGCTLFESKESPLPRETVNFNLSWKFLRIDSLDEKNSWSANFVDDSSWENVTLPHTPKIEPLVVSRQWQGVCWYRKHFRVEKAYQGKTLYLKFDGAMIVADVWINGVHKTTHLGGYLPFLVDITNDVDYGGENVIAVRLDNRNNPDVPVGRPLEKLDFCWYGGLYRNVTLVATDRLHITDPIYADKQAGGGVFVRYSEASQSSATIHVKTHVVNKDANPRACRILSKLVDADGRTVKEALTPIVEIANDKDYDFVQEITLADPKLWRPHHPYLYTLHSIVLDGDRQVDVVKTRIGVREISFSASGGFTINGQRMYLRGTNRHQEYPYIGYALSDNAQYRDARKIKDAGFDYVRLSHYPQSPAFLDACDELGLVVMNCIPGWQYMGGEQFKQLCYQNTRDLVRRDRNHPSVILWEVSLNETDMDDEFMAATHRIAHEEYPGDQFYTCGWKDARYDVFIQARQHGGCQDYENGDKACIVSEYGDWEYYAQNAGFDQQGFKDLKKEERNSRQLRGAGERRLLQQAMNFQEAHNDNRTTPAVGDGLWVMYDYNRGYSDDIEASGCMDIFRLPKFSCYFFQSQRDADISLPNAKSGPMVFIANYWSNESSRDVRVFSNCEQAALYLNGRLLGKQRPDENRFTTHLEHPPFTFRVEKFEPGVLKAVGFIAGKEAAWHEVSTPGDPVKLLLRFDRSGRDLAADGADVVFVYAEVVDEKGTIVPDAEPLVAFQVSGPGQLIGRNPIRAEAGIAAILLQAAETPGVIKVSATSKGLIDDELEINN